jgi:hypothetical protein
MKPTKCCFKRVDETKELREYNRGVNQFEVHCMHQWKYHNETTLYYNAC